jgi:hypothetical protein
MYIGKLTIGDLYNWGFRKKYFWGFYCKKRQLGMEKYIWGYTFRDAKNTFGNAKNTIGDLKNK